MERRLKSSSEFYKTILDATDRINECITMFGFTLTYSINSKTDGAVQFTLEHGRGFDTRRYTFSFNKNEDTSWMDGYIVAKVTEYIQEAVRENISRKLIQRTVLYEEPEVLLEELEKSSFALFYDEKPQKLDQEDLIQ